MSLTVRGLISLWHKETWDKLEVIQDDEKNLDNVINSHEINRPGLSLTGYFEHFRQNCIQVFGNGESGFMQKLERENRLETMYHFFEFSIPVCFFTNGNPIPQDFIEKCREHNILVYRTNLETHPFIERISQIIDEKFAQQVTIHGVFVEVFGVGILLRGKSGVGKSECALELIERGHRLVADDLVTVRQTNYRTLEGRASELTPYYMEIRGLGIIDIKNLFGIRAIREHQEIELVITLEHWNDKRTYDRLGIYDQTFKILNVDIPCLEIPVRPGRNIPIIVETAAINTRARKLGTHSARELEKIVLKNTSSKRSDYSEFDESKN